MAWILVLAPGASWITAAILVRAALVRPPIRLLTAMTVAATLGALGGTLLAPLAIARLTGFVFNPHVPAVLLVAAVLLFSLPGPAFLALYLAGWFDGRDQ